MAVLQHPRTFLYPSETAESTERYIFSGDDMGESDLQWAIAVLLTELLADYMQALNLRNKVGGNLEFLYQPGDLKAKVTPDIYVLEDESPEPLDIPSWKVWERGGKVPALAVEVVSRSAAKDYTLDPDGMLARYQQLGVAEVEIAARGRGDWVLMKVRDRGPGVAPEALEHLGAEQPGDDRAEERQEDDGG